MNKKTARVALVAAALAVTPAIAVGAAQAGTEPVGTNDGHPGMERMHELHMQGNPGMERMHELHMQGNPGMEWMHRVHMGQSHG